MGCRGWALTGVQGELMGEGLLGDSTGSVKGSALCQTKDVPSGLGVPCTLAALRPSINLLQSMNLSLHGTSPQHLPQAVETVRSRLCRPLHGCPVHHTVFPSIRHMAHTDNVALSCHGTAHHPGGRDETGASGAIVGCAFPGTGLALSQPVPPPATLRSLRTWLCSSTTC